mmetsp:Transcript_52686/g.138186  ORF Transcript_52686/g.138186 Transcript_52686/m.138186 type:complete len:232 (+) Transcript_52686:25-720(+)
MCIGARSLVDRKECVEATFAEDAWVIEAAVLVQSVDGLHLLGGQLKVEEREVLPQSRRLRRLRDDGRAVLHSPAQHDLSGGAPVSGSDFADSRFLQARVVRCGPTQFDIRDRAKVAEARHRNALFPTESDQLLLRVVRVQLDLQDRGLDLRVAQNVTQHRRPDVAHADIADQSICDQLLQSLPSFLHRNRILNHAWPVAVRVVGPLRRVARVEGNELQRNGEVYQVEVQVV